MNNLIIRYVSAFDRVIEFGSNNTLTPAISEVTTLYTNITAIAAAMRDHKGDQESGRGEFLGGSTARALKAEQVLAKMRPINKIVRSLNREQYPGVREKFYMPRTRKYEDIIGRAQAFLDSIAEVKAVLISRGLAANFDEELQEVKAELVASSGDKNEGLATQVGGTAGLLAKSREGLQQMRELDAILSHLYETNPSLLAAWKSACRVARGPVKAAAAPAPTPAPGGTVGGGAGI